jgi:hypothetical protein
MKEVTPNNKEDVKPSNSQKAHTLVHELDFDVQPFSEPQ